jgi:hypothetical protein
MATTTHLALPLLDSAQSSKEIVVNQSLALIDAMPASTVLIGTLAARPAAGWAGRLYVVTDVGNEGVFRDSGSVWTQILLGAGNHLNLKGGTVPTVAAGANAGTSPPTPVMDSGSNDSRGGIQWGTGTGAAAGAQVVVTFAVAYAVAPVVVVTARSGLTYNSGLFATTTTTGFTIAAAANPLSSQVAGAYTGQYIVIA